VALTDDDKSFAGLPGPSFAALDQLVRLHQEALQSSRLARFLAASVHAAFLFMAMAVLTLVLADPAPIGRDFSWALLILIGVLALLRCYIRTNAALDNQASPARAARELRGVFLYLGIAWGLGAFLVLPAHVGSLPALLYAAGPMLGLMLLLNDMAGLALFLASAGMIVIGAALIRSWPHGTLDTSLILILQWGLFSGALHRNREPHPAGFPQDRFLAQD
jgi:predicted permease